MPRLDLILLPFLSAYIFLTTFNLTRYYYQRVNKEKFIYLTLICAFGIATLGYSIDYFFLKSNLLLPARSLISDFISRLLNQAAVPGLKHSILIFLLAYPTAKGLNIIFTKKFSFAFTIENWGSKFDKIFWFSLNGIKDETKLLIVTLKNNKVYIGYVTRISEPIGEPFITIIPNFSGYRDKNTLEVSVTTNYTDIISEYIKNGRTHEIDSFLGVTLPISELVLVSRFNYDLFAGLKKGKNE